jgi:hypothetical protein
VIPHHIIDAFSNQRLLADATLDGDTLQLPPRCFILQSRFASARCGRMTPAYRNRPANPICLAQSMEVCMQQRGRRPQDEQGLIDHPNVLYSWLGLRLTNDATLQILFVETDLVLDTKDADFDARAIDGLVAKLREFCIANSIDGIDIIPAIEE